MNKITLLLLLLVGSLSTMVQGQIKHVYDQNQTWTYSEVMTHYRALAGDSEWAQLKSLGRSDAGLPIYIFVIDKSGEFNAEEAHANGKAIVFINNAIHPGEPCGVDASLKYAEELLVNPSEETSKMLDNVVVCIVPMYNVGGALNRGCCSRANQNGPEMHGFRGNAQNLDLNRDFIKADSHNARTFFKTYQMWDPDVFVDTHASNGADYQYTMTLIATQRNKLVPELAGYMDDVMVPHLYEKMDEVGYEMVPYVHSRGRTPDAKGIMDYLETPRYSTGYSTLFNAIGFVTETHMWKPYNERVLSTYEFLKILTKFSSENAGEIRDMRDQGQSRITEQEYFDVRWELDTTQFKEIQFKGYEGKYKTSAVTGLERLYYDRKSKFKKKIAYYNTYKPTKSIKKPIAYIIPQAYTEVIKRLELNGVKLQALTEDVDVELDMYYVEDFETNDRPYENHYLHTDVKLRTETQTVHFRKGDLVIYMNQSSNRYIVETLEPEATDSYFMWNFFDGILQQKEWFSDYIFEDKAEEILAANPELQKGLDEMKKDPRFANNHWALLYYVYQNSEYYEPTHMRYPIGRLVQETKLPVKR